MTDQSTRKQHTGYFGLCPHCRNTDGYYNVGKGHWFKCDVHKTKWMIGSNLFSSWQFETEDEQREAYYRKGYDKYQEVEPVFPPAAPDGSFQPEPGSIEAGTWGAPTNEPAPF
jgi:hypothetical protein